jgi:hypothetical protein
MVNCRAIKQRNVGLLEYRNGGRKTHADGKKQNLIGPLFHPSTVPSFQILRELNYEICAELAEGICGF